MELKLCRICREEKSLDSFYARKSSKDGLYSMCKKCYAKKNKDYWEKAGNRFSEAKRQYYFNNKKSIAKHRKVYDHEHRAERRMYERKWYKRNSERVKNKVMRRRARQKTNGVFDILEKELRKIYSSSCFHCGESNNITADHVIPISKGGRHSIGNLIPLCQSCNSAKGAKLLIEWKRSWE